MSEEWAEPDLAGHRSNCGHGEDCAPVLINGGRRAGYRRAKRLRVQRFILGEACCGGDFEQGFRKLMSECFQSKSINCGCCP
jgi:hypothetical protein